jgi:hypothetical protein
MAMKSIWGGGLMVLAGALGLVVGLRDYYSVATGIDGTGGVELVMVSSLLMVLGAVLVMVLPGGYLAGIFLVLLFLDVIGTGVAGFFLESGLIMAAMALAAVGWILEMNARGRVA